MKIIVTGGAGFIGTSVVHHLLDSIGATVVNVDKLTYAGAHSPLAKLPSSSRYCLERIDICDRGDVESVFDRHRPDAVMHLAAESHVDRSIDRPDEFIASNVVGTFNLLEVARRYWSNLPAPQKELFRFHHISTDEVFGSLAGAARASEETRYQPNSPYSASKAGADHLVRAWHRTYGLPLIATNCSNNYGPWQFPEKLIPLIILNAIEGRELPVYGDGSNVRDWLYVQDHAEALVTVLGRGRIGETYNIAGGGERSNLEIVKEVCAILDAELPRSPHRPHERLIRFVVDRAGHDQRYAIDDSKMRTEFGWTPRETLSSGLRKTVRWYLDNRAWWEAIRAGTYRGERLGLGVAGDVGSLRVVS